MRDFMQGLKKYKAMVLYIVFGILTTVVNVAVYYLCYERAGMENVPSTAAAWLLSVVFAFITNKLYVFQSSSMSGLTVFKEALKFGGCRLGTGAGELAVMYLFVDLLHFSGTTMKIITNVIVIILNYIVSKLFVFKDSGTDRV